jgi:MFS transporter, FSR family, fosmidomycin resistance protein
MSMTASTSHSAESAPSKKKERRALGVACGAHVLHDGYTDLIYVMLPIWQGEFGLGFAVLGLMKTVFSGALAGFQIPSGMLGERFGVPLVLAGGTALAGIGYCLVGLSGGMLSLFLALFIGGLGASPQHPLGSSFIAQTFAGLRSRTALGTYNFSGDIGKMTLPLIASLLFLVLSWRNALLLLGAFGLLVAAVIFIIAPRAEHAEERPGDADMPEPAGHAHAFGFPLLLSVGMIDNATRAAFLTFLPFVLTGKGASVQTVGLALTLVFAGGAAGKLVCTFIGNGLGTVATVWLTETLTAVGMLAILPLPLESALVILSVIGIALNGTSSVLYGSVPELVPPEKRTRAFSIFYTGAIGSGALAPTVYGFLGDAAGITVAVTVAAGILLLTLPLTALLGPALASATAAES